PAAGDARAPLRRAAVQQVTINRERILTMTNTNHTPGPWQLDWQFIVAPDPDGIHPDIYIAEIAEEDSDGRVVSPEQQRANGRLIAAPRFRVGDTDSYKIAAIVDRAIAEAREA